MSISYAKEVEPIQPHGLIAIDRNLDNLTVADSDGQMTKQNLAKATEVKAMYREIRSHMRRNDLRIRQRVTGKYGRKQREKVKQILHHASKQIVLDAKRREFGIVMEKLTGIRKLYRKGNWQGRRYRGTNEQLELLRTATTNRVQSPLGRHTRHLRESVRHFGEVFDMWVKNETRREPNN